MSCNNTITGLECYDIPHCPVELVIPTFYTEQNVIIDIENENGHVHRVTGTTSYGQDFTSEVQTSYDGVVIASDFPKAFFNEYSGQFTATIKDPDDNEAILPIVANSIKYDFYIFKVIKRFPLESNRQARLTYKE